MTLAIGLRTVLPLFVWHVFLLTSQHQDNLPPTATSIDEAMVVLLSIPSSQVSFLYVLPTWTTILVFSVAV